MFSCPNTTCERLFLPPTEWSWHPCREFVDHNCEGFSLDSQNRPHRTHVHLSASTTRSLGGCRFVGYVEIMMCQSSNFILHLQYCFGYSRFAEVIFDKDIKVVSWGKYSRFNRVLEQSHTHVSVIYFYFTLFCL